MVMGAPSCVVKAVMSLDSLHLIDQMHFPSGIFSFGKRQKK